MKYNQELKIKTKNSIYGQMPFKNIYIHMSIVQLGFLKKHGPFRAINTIKMLNHIFSKYYTLITKRFNYFYTSNHFTLDKMFLLGILLYLFLQHSDYYW